MADGSAAPDDAASRIERNMFRAMAAARWIMIPIYLGLVVALVLDLVKFFQKLVTAFPDILTMDTSETILTVLTLIDLALVGNLVVIVVFSSWESFIGPRSAGPDAGGFGSGFSAVKQKLIGSVAAIAAIQILETFVHIESVAKTDAMWQLAILLGIGVTGVLLALMDRLARGGQ